MPKHQRIYCAVVAAAILIIHQIVALIAEAHLNDTTRDRLKPYFRRTIRSQKHPYGRTKVRKALPQKNPLHYVDAPRGATEYDRERDCPQRNCMVEAVTWYLNVLKSNDSPLGEGIK